MGYISLVIALIFSLIKSEIGITSLAHFAFGKKAVSMIIGYVLFLLAVIGGFPLIIYSFNKPIWKFILIFGCYVLLVFLYFLFAFLADKNISVTQQGIPQMYGRFLIGTAVSSVLFISSSLIPE